MPEVTISIMGGGRTNKYLMIYILQGLKIN